MCFFVTFKPDTSSWMNYNGNKSIANISISNPGFAGTILMLRGAMEPSCVVRTCLEVRASQSAFLVLLTPQLHSYCPSLGLLSACHTILLQMASPFIYPYCRNFRSLCPGVPCLFLLKYVVCLLWECFVYIMSWRRKVCSGSCWGWGRL